MQNLHSLSHALSPRTPKVPYALLPVLISTGVLQLKHLNLAQKHFDSNQVGAGEGGGGLRTTERGLVGCWWTRDG